jgi:phytoene dehydrogenase-like protein
MADTQFEPNRVVVIGGGLAGLAAATYLARGGRAVTVLEKTAALGGRATTDYPHGFALNRGAHALYSGGALSEVLRELGVTYSFGIPRHVVALDARGMHRLPTAALDLLTTTLLDARDKREFAAFFVRLRGVSPDAHAHESIVGWIESMVRRPRLRQLLASLARVQTFSSALDLIAADVFIDRLQQTTRHPVHYVSGGWQTLVDGLREVAVRTGVRVHVSAAAEAVDVAGGFASGVWLHDGARIAASEVVLAVPPDDALRLLGGARAPHLAQHVGNLVPGYVAALDLGLQALPTAKHPVVFDLERSRFLTAQSTVASLAPAGGAVIHTFTQPDFRAAPQAPAERAELEDLLDTAQPGWREVVVEQRFLPRMLGVSSLPLVSRGGLRGRAPHRSQDVPNVYFAGDWVGPRGYLADASMASARESARLVLESAVRLSLQAA